ncbi:hypothetical protein R3X27_25095 [Tropicimonas sp. TH_r6]|uniref:hypothetical protein n=1 Tax=Tropicimonas sp. TH_r6 TaxID=3082085 RepID=UPI002953ADAD|nr:hypothetical protein [Tropicimonas sp. TH_r6]MDV7145966.1 hypothetical protein [Tropicimonas sp. TH_r6]
MESFLKSYSVAWDVVRAAFLHPRQFYKVVVTEINLISLLVFYFQFQAAIIWISTRLFEADDSTNAESFFEKSLIVTVHGVILSTLVISLIIYALLRIMSVPVSLGQIAKYIAVTFLMGQMIVGGVQLFLEYYVYVQSGGYAWMEDWREPEPVYATVTNFIINSILAPSVFIVSGVLLALSSNQILKASFAFIVGVLFHILILTPFASHFWLQFLQG